MKFPEKWYLVLTDENIKEVINFFEENKDYFDNLDLDIQDRYNLENNNNYDKEPICFEFEKNEYADLCYKSKLLSTNNTKLTLKDIASIIKEKKEILANILANLTIETIKEKEIGVKCETYEKYCKFCKLLDKEKEMLIEDNWYNDGDYIWYWDNEEGKIYEDNSPYDNTYEDKPRIVISFKDIKLTENYNLIYY